MKKQNKTNKKNSKIKYKGDIGHQSEVVRSHSLLSPMGRGGSESKRLRTGLRIKIELGYSFIPQTTALALSFFLLSYKISGKFNGKLYIITVLSYLFNTKYSSFNGIICWDFNSKEALSECTTSYLYRKPILNVLLKLIRLSKEFVLQTSKR